MKKFSRQNLCFLLVILLLGILTSVVYAANITVDGDPSDWPGNPGCTILDPGCSQLANDPDESASTSMPAGTDVRTVWGTNSTTHLFARFDTEATTVNFSGGEFVRLCLDIVAQGPGQTDVGGCSGFNTDRLLWVTDFGSGPEVRAYNCNAVNCNSPFAASTGTGTFSQSGVVNELSIVFSALGLSSTDDGSTMNMVVYFDNNGLPQDDNIPDSGTLPWPIGSGSPTAITLNNLNTTSSQAALPIALALIFGLFIVTTLFVVLKRRQAL
jgi:hypothetical protein